MPTGLQDGFDGGEVQRLVGVAARRHAQRQRQVVRSDIDAAEMRRRHDRLQVLDALARLDHRDAGDLAVRLRGIALAAVERGADRAERAVAERRIEAGADRQLRLGAGVHQRHDDPHRAGVEDLHDLERQVAGRPHQRRHLGGRDRRQHVAQVLVVDEAVLHVDAQPVEAGVRHHLGDMGVVHGEPAAEGLLPRAPLGERLVLPHR
jgi:hypothetical protein